MTNEVTRTAPKRECDHFRDCMSAREVRRIVDERDSWAALAAAADADRRKEAANSINELVELYADNERLRSDLARRVAIAAEQAGEIERLRAAPSSLPVAWQLISCLGTAETWIRMTPPIDNVQEWRPLYAHPAPNDKVQHDALLSALALATDKARHLCRLIRGDSIVLDALHGNDELPAVLVATESAIRISNEALDAFLSEGNKRDG